MTNLYCAVHSDVVNGSRLFGPFKTEKEVNQMALANFEEFANLLPIVIDNSSDCHDYLSGDLDSIELFTICTGNAFDGLKLQGLYKTCEEAIDVTGNINIDQWFIINIERTEYPD